MLKVAKMSMELTDALIDMERHGIKISNENLDKIQQTYEQEYRSLQHDLKKIVSQVMGDTPINLDSPDDRSVLIYSRKVTDKNEWKSVFNIGSEWRGNTRKPKYKTRMSPQAFNSHVKLLAPVERKTIGKQCPDCKGLGFYNKKLKSGKLSEHKTKCKTCLGTGVCYESINEAAGLRVIPRGVEDTCAAGFKTDKETLEQILAELTGLAHDFVEKYTRYSKIRTYLNTFVDSLGKFQDSRGFIHPQFNQCITATGRLSSSKPNFQNMPRGNTFPAREAIVSRFEDGYILEGDYSQLEFRVAGFLSKDKTIYKEVTDGFDVHSYTASVMGVSRQEAKSHTFKPLYGGILGTDKQMRYYSAFKEKYSGITQWHEDLQNEAVSTKKVVLPSGREYAFKFAKFTSRGTATNATAIKNYPVQGFATADLLPLALIKLHKRLRELNKQGVQSLLINTVHDSLVMDVHPQEKEQMVDLMKECMLCISEECKVRYDLVFDMPIDIELKIGRDWLNLEEI
jgi:DNA polymerase I-like protein with 3'-5' exonuclease and polymerase domains